MVVIVRVLAAIGAVVTIAAVFALATAHGFSAREGPGALEAKLARFVRVAMTPAVKRPVGVPSQGARDHWADHCAGCHAADGSGEIAVGRGMNPRAPDMRAAPTQALSDGQLYWIIQNGVRFSGMPAWGEPRDDDHATWALVDFIRELPKLTPADVAAIANAMPISEHERHEREDEDAFLRGE